MEVKCTKQSYICMHKDKCDSCGYNHAVTDGEYLVLPGKGRSIRVRVKTPEAAKRLIGAHRASSSDNDYIVTDCKYNQFVLQGKGVELAEGELGQALESMLRPYQAADLKAYGKMPKLLNANTMGYGKTIEAIMYAWINGCRKILIIVPKSVIKQWHKELDKWWPESKKDIVIVNYDKFSRSKTFVEKFKNQVWDLIVCDEAHRIKNRKSKRSEAIKKIPASRKMALTGTPIMRRVDDLFGICDWLDPTLFGQSYWNFVEMFAEIDENYFGKKIIGNTKNEKTLDTLNEFLKSFTIRNPEIMIGKGSNVNSVTLEMYKEVAELYKGIKTNIILEIGDDISIMNAMGKCIRLRQLTSNPSVFGSEYANSNPKFEWIRDLIEDNPEIKIVVFSCFTQTILALQKFLKPGACSVYHGELNLKQREQAKKMFMDNAETQILAGTVGSMSEAVDGLQYHSNTVVFLDRDWSPEVMRQAESRLIRDGQEKVVNIYYLECENSIDQTIGKINVKKSEDVRRILDE